MDQHDRPRLLPDGGDERDDDHEHGDGHAREYEHWRFDPLFPPRPEALPERLALTDEAEEREDADEYTAVYESICGATDDSQPVELYDGTLGVTEAFVDDHERPVGQLQWNDDLASQYQNPGNVSGVRWATGTLISENLFLTAGHNFDQTGGDWVRPRIDGTLNTIPPAEIATNMHVNFNFQVAPDGTFRPESEFAIEELVEYRLDGLDYAIVRLAGAPGNDFGVQDVAADDAAEGDMLCIIGHPAGRAKRIEAGPTFHLHDDRIGYDDIDTLGGNSGSGILNLEGEIVGVHTHGGCDAARSGHNHGFRISSIRAASPTIQTLDVTLPTLPQLDDVPTFPQFDDPPTLPALDQLPTIPRFDDPPTSPFLDRLPTIPQLDDPPTSPVLDRLPTSPRLDDPPTSPILDRFPTSPQRDDPPTSPFVDRLPTSPQRDDPPTLPHVDYRKTAGLDTPPGLDPDVDPRLARHARGLQPRSGLQPRARPFALATPHHASMGMHASGDQRQMASHAEYEAALAHLETQYQQLLAEYEQLLHGTTG